MATVLYLRNTTVESLGITGYYDLSTTAGASIDTCVTNTTAGGTNIQLTKTAGGTAAAWMSRAIGIGFTLTTTDISLWQMESHNQANSGGRYRLYKYDGTTGVETELLGGPFNDGVEMSTSYREDTWTGNPTDTAFVRGDRLVLKVYITNIGTMGGSRTCTMGFNAAGAATGDSWLNINETITFLNRVFVSHY